MLRSGRRPPSRRLARPPGSCAPGVRSGVSRGDAAAAPQEGGEGAGPHLARCRPTEPLRKPRVSRVRAVRGARGGTTLLESGCACWNRRPAGISVCVIRVLCVRVRVV